VCVPCKIRVQIETQYSLVELTRSVWPVVVLMSGRLDVREGGPIIISLVLLKFTTMSFSSDQVNSLSKHDCMLDCFILLSPATADDISVLLTRICSFAQSRETVNLSS